MDILLIITGVIAQVAGNLLVLRYAYSRSNPLFFTCLFLPPVSLLLAIFEFPRMKLASALFAGGTALLVLTESVFR